MIFFHTYIITVCVQQLLPFESDCVSNSGVYTHVTTPNIGCLANILLISVCVCVSVVESIMRGEDVGITPRRSRSSTAPAPLPPHTAVSTLQYTMYHTSSLLSFYHIHHGTATFIQCYKIVLLNISRFSEICLFKRPQF